MKILKIIVNVIGLALGALFLTGGTDAHLGAGIVMILMSLNALLTLND